MPTTPSFVASHRAVVLAHGVGRNDSPNRKKLEIFCNTKLSSSSLSSQRYDEPALLHPRC
jgi:hypothetical protein